MARRDSHIELRPLLKRAIVLMKLPLALRHIGFEKRFRIPKQPRNLPASDVTSSAYSHQAQLRRHSRKLSSATRIDLARPHSAAPPWTLILRLSVKMLLRIHRACLYGSDLGANIKSAGVSIDMSVTGHCCY